MRDYTPTIPSDFSFFLTLSRKEWGEAKNKVLHGGYYATMTFKSETRGEVPFARDLSYFNGPFSPPR